MLRCSVARIRRWPLLLLCLCTALLSGCRRQPALADLVAGGQAATELGISGAEAGGATDKPASPPVEIFVHISGAVAVPGVYRLAEGARGCDGLAAAGGAARDACLAEVNLAAKLSDGQQLHIPSKAEVAAGSAGGGMTGGKAAATKQSGPLDVNRATAAQLESLPGIGPVLAARVVAYRIANGPFAKVDDLIGVQGIGERTLAALRPLLTVLP